jgi:FKBP-type peptidyl-prolyl cis-trans isomerase SlyD
MNIAKNNVVELSFKLFLDDFDGELIQEFTKDEPFKFIFGTGSLLESFEDNIKGMSPGDKFKFKLTAEEAYGEVDEEAIIDLPHSFFNIDEDYIYIGSVLPFKDEEGNEIEGTIIDINDDAVTVDFNHPLAGEDLYIEGEVLSVRKATPDELNHGHVH